MVALLLAVRGEDVERIAVDCSDVAGKPLAFQ